jgi:hypothetical protein
MSRYYLPFTHLHKLHQLSERGLAQAAMLSRGAVRQLLYPARKGNVTMSSIEHLAQAFDRDVEVVVGGSDIFSEYSSVATALKIERDSFDSWKTHLFNFVDEFRRTMDGRLVILPPPSCCDRRITALLASTVRALCEELDISTPRWATLRYFIPTPWFVSGMNSLKASALLESPIHFRANNIFVLSNFLSRV